MNKLTLRRGVDAFPKSYKFQPGNNLHRAVYVNTVDIDIDLVASFDWGPENCTLADAIPLLDPNTGDPIVMPMPATDDHFGIMLNDFGAPTLFVTFTPSVGPALAVSSAEQSGNIDQLNAQVQFSVDPKLSETLVSVEYGLTAAYGSHVDVALPLAGNAGVSPFLLPLANLVPGSTYHWRVKMVNSVGTSYGDDQTFETLAVAEATIAAENDETGATMSIVGGTVNPNGGDTTVIIEYGLTAAYGSEAIPLPAEIPAGVEAVAVAANLSNLEPAQTYHWRIVATNSAGTAEGADQTFLTDDAVPVVAAEASVPTAADCAVSATVDTNGDETVVTIEWGLTDAYGEVPVAVAESPIAAGNVPVPITATIPGLAAETTYHWRIKAVNAVGTTYGADQTFDTLAE